MPGKTAVNVLDHSDAVPIVAAVAVMRLPGCVSQSEVQGLREDVAELEQELATWPPIKAPTASLAMVAS